MKLRTMIVATFWLAIVAGSTVAIATHSVSLPPVSHGGEMAYVRNFSPETPGPAMWSPYASMTLRADHGEVWDFSSEGRLGSTVVFEKMSLPAGIPLSSPSYVPVAHLDRGMLVAEGSAGRFLALSAVNAAFAVQALEPMTVRLLVPAEFDVVQVSPSQVSLSLGDHSYALQTLGDDDGFGITGRTVAVTLGAGDELRGFIDSFPATKAVMEDAFDHAWS